MTKSTDMGWGIMGYGLGNNTAGWGLASALYMVTRGPPGEIPKAGLKVSPEHCWRWPTFSPLPKKKVYGLLLSSFWLKNAIRRKEERHWNHIVLHFTVKLLVRNTCGLQLRQNMGWVLALHDPC